jgi:hypothetical protein
MSSAQNAFDELAGTRRRRLQRELDEIDQIRQQRCLSDPDPDDGSVEAHASEEGGEVRDLRNVRLA